MVNKDELTNSIVDEDNNITQPPNLSENEDNNITQPDNLDDEHSINSIVAEDNDITQPPNLDNEEEDTEFEINKFILDLLERKGITVTQESLIKLKKIIKDYNITEDILIEIMISGSVDNLNKLEKIAEIKTKYNIDDDILKVMVWKHNLVNNIDNFIEVAEIINKYNIDNKILKVMLSSELVDNIDNFKEVAEIIFEYKINYEFFIILLRRKILNDTEKFKKLAEIRDKYNINSDILSTLLQTSLLDQEDELEKVAEIIGKFNINNDNLNTMLIKGLVDKGDGFEKFEKVAEVINKYNIDNDILKEMVSIGVGLQDDLNKLEKIAEITDRYKINRDILSTLLHSRLLDQEDELEKFEKVAEVINEYNIGNDILLTMMSRHHFENFLKVAEFLYQNTINIDEDILVSMMRSKLLSNIDKFKKVAEFLNQNTINIDLYTLEVMLKSDLVNNIDNFKEVEEYLSQTKINIDEYTLEVMLGSDLVKNIVNFKKVAEFLSQTTINIDKGTLIKMLESNNLIKDINNFEKVAEFLSQTKINIDEDILEVMLKSDLVNNIDDFKKVAEIMHEYNNKIDKYILELILKRKDLLNNIIEDGDKISQALQIYQLALNSPSKEINNFLAPILEEVLNTENPIEKFKEIEKIFTENMIPLFAKRLLILDALMDSSDADYDIANVFSPIISKYIGKNTNSEEPAKLSSEELKRKALRIIYRDLVQISLDASDPDLKEYLLKIKRVQELINKYSIDRDSFSNDEKDELEYSLSRLEVLYKLSDLPQQDNEVHQDLNTRIAQLAQNIGVDKHSEISDRLARMFLGTYGKGKGIKTVQEALDYIDNNKKNTIEKNKELARRIKAEGITSIIKNGEGTLIKGLTHDINILPKIIRSGMLCKDVLGFSADATPFDIDFLLLQPDTTYTNDEIRKELNNMLGIIKIYGDIRAIVLTDNSNILIKEVEDEENKPGLTTVRNTPYELFKSPVIDKMQHHGIRTGFPSVSALVCPKERVSEVMYTLARENLYIPILDEEDLNLVYTYEQFLETKNKYLAGVPKFSDIPYEVKLDEQPIPEIKQLIVDIQEDKEKNKEVSDTIEKYIQEALEQSGIKLQKEYEDNLRGAVIRNTGSTGRGTGVPGDSDYDFSVELNTSDQSTLNAFIAGIEEKFDIKEGNLTKYEIGSATQLQFEVDLGAYKGVKIDIGINPINTGEIYPNHQSIIDIFESIRVKEGEENLIQVKANIVLAKKLLKEKGSYKKLEGGLGGIGTELWILQNGGSLTEAFKDLLKHTNNGEMPFNDFIDSYHIYDIGVNLRHIDVLKDHIKNLNIVTYNNLIDIAKEFLSKKQERE